MYDSRLCTCLSKNCTNNCLISRPATLRLEKKRVKYAANVMHKNDFSFQSYCTHATTYSFYLKKIISIINNNTYFITVLLNFIDHALFFIKNIFRKLILVAPSSIQRKKTF